MTVLEGPPSSSQPGFIEVILSPFFNALLPIAPGLGDEYMKHLHKNRWVLGGGPSGRLCSMLVIADKDICRLDVVFAWVV